MNSAQINIELDHLDRARCRARRLASEHEVYHRYHAAKADCLGIELDRLTDRLHAAEEAERNAQPPTPPDQVAARILLPPERPCSQPKAAAIEKAPAAEAGTDGTAATHEPVPACRRSGSGPKEDPQNIARVRAVPEPFTRQSLAVALGKTADEVTQLLNRWSKKGWVAKAGGRAWNRTQQFPPAN